MACSVLIIGCGDLGSTVARLLDQRRFAIHALRHRGTESPPGVQLLRADVTDAASISMLADLQPEIVLYCVAAPERTAASYQAHYVDGLNNVLQQTRSPRLRHVFFVSSTSVYGQESTALIDEKTPAQPANFSGECMLRAESLLAAAGLSHTILRLSGIYGPGRLRLIRQARAVEDWPAKNNWSNRIHRDDAARFIVTLLERRQRGESLQACYLVTDSTPVPQYDALRWLAEQQGVTPRSISLPVTGRRLSNARMLDTGFELEYPDYRSGYAALLASV